MNKIIIFLVILFSYLDGIGGTYDADTIENWQIYNGNSLIHAGHGTMTGEFQVLLRYNRLKDIKVVYNHCGRLIEGNPLWVSVSTNKTAQRWTKEYRTNAEGMCVIPFSALSSNLESRNVLTIWYNALGGSSGQKLAVIIIER
jgi:hypothetical protein